jgi:hypothetical protein
MSGLTYNGKTESGEARWDALKNCKLTIHETAITLQVSNNLNRHLFIYLPHLPWNISILKRHCQLQCIARSNNARRPFYWRSNSCFGFQSIIYFNHPMVILAHFN